MIFIIDIHTHILPGVDDGADSISDALDLLNLAKRYGTKEIVLTPHFPNHKLEDEANYSVYNKVFNDFVNNPQVQQIGIKLYAGAENYCTSSTLDRIRQKQLITINNTEYALIEFNENEQCSFMQECIESLFDGGYKPIIAHAERYQSLQHNARMIEEFKDRGCIIQVNANSLICGGVRQRFADWIFGNSFADVVASDAHNMIFRTSNLSLAYEELSHRYSFAYAEELLEINPSYIISGKAIK